jgi:two-component system, cell cycle sensor histidine kinase and response regulator CckA
MAGGVAHEFSNLLLVIAGQAERVLSALGPQHASRGDVAEIRRASEAAIQITTQLLAVSQRQVLSPRALDLNDLVQSMSPALRRMLSKDTRVELRFALEPGLPLVEVDEAQLVRAITNLVANARDAMPDGGAVTVLTRTTGDSGQTVQLSVVDTGCGIPGELHELIFYPFFTTKGPGRGAGLGLAAVRGILAQTGGSVSVSSQPGRGSTFTLSIPAFR